MNSGLDFSSCGDQPVDSAAEILHSYRVWRREHPQAPFKGFVRRRAHLDSAVLIELATTDLIQQISAGSSASAEDYIVAFPILSEDANLQLDLVDAEICARSDRGDLIDSQDFHKRFPSLKKQLANLFAVHEIDMEAEDGGKPAPYSVAGIEFVHCVHRNHGRGEHANRFELWHVVRSKDQRPLLAFVWDYEPDRHDKDSFASLLKERSRLAHPCLIKPLSAGLTRPQAGQRQIYVLTPPIKGRTLVQHLIVPGGSLSEEAIAGLILKAYDASQFLERELGRRIPLSVGSIFLGQNETPLLIDYMHLASDCESDPLLQLGLLLFATCLHESDVSELEKHVKAGFEPVALSEINSSVSAEMNSIFLACVQPDDGNRYATVEEAMDDLRRFIARKPIKASQRRRKWFGL